MKKKVLIYGFLTLFALANVIVAVSNERQKSMLISNNVEAKSNIADWILFYLWYIDNNGGSNSNTAEKYRERNNLTCPPFEIYNGQHAIGSDAARLIETKLNLTGGATNGSGYVQGESRSSWQSSKHSSSSTHYEYHVVVTPVGNDWVLKTCEPCADNDPEIATNCRTYNECGEYVQTMGDSYRSALGI